MTIATLTATLTAKMNDYATAVSNRIKNGGKFTGPAYTAPVVVAFSTTPVFDASLTNVFQFGVMTNNVPGATITNPHDGQTITIRFQQDGVGGRTFTMPGNCQVSGSPTTTANAVNLLSLTYDAAASKWEGSWVPVQ